jgi:hypothetical protein
VCASINPGRTSLVFASIIFSALLEVKFADNEVMIPFFTPMSALDMDAEVIIVPFFMIKSKEYRSTHLIDY